MARRVWTVERINEIKRLIKEGQSDRQIARVLHCRRSLVKGLRGADTEEAPEGTICALMAPPLSPAPPWTDQVVWPVVLEEIGRGFEIKRIWEERAGSATGYSNFWKYLNRRYPALMQDTVTLREFEAGTHCEVDWAGDKVEWRDAKGHRKEAHIFVGVLCFSQLIFAHAFDNEQKVNWLTAHEKMYAYFGGVPRVTVPDNLKTGTKRPHLYDPDLNPAYVELAAHYRTAIVPARVAKPQDKALAENAVGIVMRFFKWKNRNRRFRSLAEVNTALQEAVDQINLKPHSRLKVSRKERWEKLEKEALKPLPEVPFEIIDWKTARVHPDSMISVEGALYSVPHVHRGREVRVKLTARQVEVFAGLERVALHARDRSKSGGRHRDSSHFPPNSKAYYEATPQNLLSQARFISADLRALIDYLFAEDALGHLRRAQGIIREARKEIQTFGRTQAEPRIAEAVALMRRFDRIRVRDLAEHLKNLRERSRKQETGAIERKPGNPMLRRNQAEASGHGIQQPLLLPERTESDGNDTTESAHGGTQADGDGLSLRQACP